MHEAGAGANAEQASHVAALRSGRHDALREFNDAVFTVAQPDLHLFPSDLVTSQSPTTQQNRLGPVPSTIFTLFIIFFKVKSDN